MKYTTSKLSRRKLLVGTGGVTLALPFLESLSGRQASGSKSYADDRRFAVFVCHGNGVAQKLQTVLNDQGGISFDEPEQFWPNVTFAGNTRSAGISAANLSAIDTAIGKPRAVVELAAYANKIALVRGTHYSFTKRLGGGHPGGNAEALTAGSYVMLDPSSQPEPDATTVAERVSLDTLLSETLFPNLASPLCLHASWYFGETPFSYSHPRSASPLIQDPWTLYSQMTRLNNLSDVERTQIKSARKSVNDFVRDQLSTLRKSPFLSLADQRKLDGHQSAIREAETSMACLFTQNDSTAVRMASESRYANDPRRAIEIAEAHIRLIALAFACDYTRVATLMFGRKFDDSVYAGSSNDFHTLSHRFKDLFAGGKPDQEVTGAKEAHHEVDRLRLKNFKFLLDKLTEHAIFDQSVAVHLNSLGTGPDHNPTNIPYVLAGSCGGKLKTGVYVDAAGATHNKLLNTIGGALGLKNKAGTGWIDDFGDPSLEKGDLGDLLVAAR